jgi:hypothetical protein
MISKHHWETKPDATGMNIISNDVKMKEQQPVSEPPKLPFSNGVISQHINRLHQKAQLAQSQPKSSVTSNTNMICASSHTNLSSSSSQMTSSRPQNNIDPFSPSTNMTQQQNDLSMQHSLQHRSIGRPQTNDQAGNSRRASDPVRVLNDGKTYHVAGHHMTQSSRQRSGSYNHLNHSSSNNTNYDHGTSYNSPNHQNIDVTSNRHVRNDLQERLSYLKTIVCTDLDLFSFFFYYIRANDNNDILMSTFFSSF